MKRLTLAGQIGIIIIVCMLVLFLSGLMVMQSLQSSYLEMLYVRTQQLIKQGLRETEERVSNAKQTAYDIIVSDATQNSVSGYWDAYDAGYGRAALLSWTDGITSSIANYLKINGDVLCANYIGPDDMVRVIASRNYIKLSDEQAMILYEMAVEEDGGTLLVRGDTVGMDENTLIVLKQLREKRKLSMRNSGAVALFLSFDELGSALTDAWEGAFELKNEEVSMTLGGGSSALFEGRYIKEGYSLVNREGTQYFVLNIDGKLFTSCLAALPYNPLFATTKQLLMRHTIIYAVCCATVFALALALISFATRDFGKLRRHLAEISAGESEVISKIEAVGKSSDADELYKAFNAMAKRINGLTKDNYEARLAVKDAQLSALQAQINPHFLYNTLNSIYWAAKSGENDSAAAMTQDLSTLLRDAVNTDESVVSIDRELEITCNYIRIQKQRYRERLNVEFDIDSEVSDLAIPKFTIQPLLENAIKYGIENLISGGIIEIRIEKNENKCVCMVKNQGPPPDINLNRLIREGDVKGHGSGIGLVNIDRRIRAMFGDECGVTIYRDEEDKRTITRVDFVAIPFRERGDAN